ncbi:MAG TPA: putative nucleotide-diphospho-sugar transferase [Chthoniobacteraceae bacterium]|nr:hypothetical protein [Chthoniobacter sp.]HEV7866826.1 putative nucleotide-diphospho-sugar transferase [Chthoniobacteraceae bacterium]
MTARRHLVYTIALDYEGCCVHRNMAKMLVSSLLRTRFSGDVLVFHNSPIPLFQVPRVGIFEKSLKVPPEVSHRQFGEFVMRYKHGVAADLPMAGYDKVMFLDCDTIALRNIDHLLEGDWDLAFCVEPGSRIQDGAYGAYLTADERKHSRREGINSGTWAVAASRCAELLERWKELQTKPTGVNFRGFRDQVTLNRVVLDWDGVAREFPRNEVALPLCNGHAHTYGGFSRAALVHAASADGPDYKLRFLFSLFAGAFLYDTELALLNIMEM